MRHVPQGSRWHPATDDLWGTQQYGDPEDDSGPWSVLWKLEETDEFLFASGNMKYWLVVSREELLGSNGDKIYYHAPITVMASSYSSEQYQGPSSLSRSLIL